MKLNIASVLNTLFNFKDSCLSLNCQKLKPDFKEIVGACHPHPLIFFLEQPLNMVGNLSYMKTKDVTKISEQLAHLRRLIL